MKPLQSGFIRVRILRGWQHIDTWDMRAVPRVDEYIECGGAHGRRGVDNVVYHRDGTVDVHV